LHGQKRKNGFIVNENGQVEVSLSERENRLLDLIVQNWTMGHLNNTLTFPKTQDLRRCKYCFIANCAQL
jgi:hypothetical protein